MLIYYAFVICAMPTIFFLIYLPVIRTLPSIWITAITCALSSVWCAFVGAIIYTFKLA